MEAGSGQILLAENPHLPWTPASLVKMMGILIVVEGVNRGELDWSEPVKTSAEASRMGGSQVFLKEGEVFTLEELMRAIAIGSANDACYAVAEHASGSVEAFVERMNERARELGMTATRYVNVHGLPPGRGREGNITNAYDYAILGRELVKHPKVLEWTSTRRTTFRDGSFILDNTNALIRSYPDADGLKTGYLASSRFNLVATAWRDGVRLIAVVLGAPTNGTRYSEARRMLTIGFEFYRNLPEGFLFE